MVALGGITARISCILKAVRWLLGVVLYPWISTPRTESFGKRFVSLLDPNRNSEENDGPLPTIAEQRWRWAKTLSSLHSAQATKIPESTPESSPGLRHTHGNIDDTSINTRRIDGIQNGFAALLFIIILFLSFRVLLGGFGLTGVVGL